MIALIDYGAGNLTSIRKALAAVGLEAQTPRRPARLLDVAGIVVPGVGHFAATTALDEDWRRALREAVGAGTPLLGICLGLQFLFEGSEEAPEAPGLALLEGRCTRLPAAWPAGTTARDPRLKVPHVGWNTVEYAGPSRLLSGCGDGAFAYFTHSYVAPVTPACSATTTYGVRFASVVERGAVAGVQFHPEKSGDLGLRVLANFAAATAAFAR
jgi:glutamine amidotransferase